MQVFVIGFATVGTVLLLTSHAASPFVSIEAEQGDISGSICTISDSAASSGNAVQFKGNTPTANAIVLNSSVVYQTMDGFGSSSRVFDDPHVTDTFNSATGRAAVIIPQAQQSEIMDRLYRDLKLTRIRPILESDGIERVNDNSDPLNTNLSMFDLSWKMNDAHIDTVKSAQSRGLPVYWLSPVKYADWMNDSTDKQEFVEWTMVVLRRWQGMGVSVPYYSIINEPSYSRSGTWSGEWMRDVIKLLGPAMRAEGMNTMLVVPDDVRSSDGATKAGIILADPSARQYIGALATHLYDEDTSNISQMSQLSDQYDLPLWMSEFYSSANPNVGGGFGWANLMHQLLTNNVTAIDYMWSYFGQWTNTTDMLVKINNNGNTYINYTLQKEYYMMGQYSRVIAPGFKRLGVSNVPNNILVTAYSQGNQRVIVAINNNSTDTSATFNLGVCGATSVLSFRTSDSEDWADLPAITPQGGNFTTTLKSLSVTTFTTQLP